MDTINTQPIYTSQIQNTSYHEASWWALDNDGQAWAGPCKNQMSLYAQVKNLNKTRPEIRIILHRGQSC